MSKITNLILVGKISLPHGVHGAVKINSYTENPLDIVKYGDIYNIDGSLCYKIKNIKHGSKGFLIAKIEGITDRNQAEMLKGIGLYIERENLPAITNDNEFYCNDLVDFLVFLDKDRKHNIGKVKAVKNFGAGDLLEIDMIEAGDSEFFPFTNEVVTDIDFDNKMLFISPMEEIIAKQD